MKRVLPYLLIFFAMILDTSLLPFMAPTWEPYLPSLSLVAAATLATMFGRTYGLLYGLTGGLLYDITVGIPMGLSATTYTVGAFLAGWIARKMRGRISATLVAPLATLTLHELVSAVYHAIQASAVERALLGHALVRILVGVVLAQPLYLLYNAILKPQYSRYAMR